MPTRAKRQAARPDVAAGLDRRKGLRPVVRGPRSTPARALAPDDDREAQALGEQLRGGASEGLVYPSVRRSGGECVGLFHPDLASNPRQARHLDYHWDGTRVDLFREPASGSVYRIT
jgi:RES domain